MTRPAPMSYPFTRAAVAMADRRLTLLREVLWMVEAHEGTSDENDALVDRVRAETRAQRPDSGTDTTDNDLHRLRSGP